MEPIRDLSAKLTLGLRAASLSRVELASRIGVDKSLVSRWLSGTVHPTEHNLARLTGLLSERLGAFSMADWFEPTEAFAQRLGVAMPEVPTAQLPANLGPLTAFLEAARPELDHRGSAYEGFWRTSRPSLLMADKLFHDYGMIRRVPGGMIEVVMEGTGLDFSGWLFPLAGNVFVFLFDTTGRTPLTVQFKGVSLPKAAVLDGILLLSALDSARTPAAVPIIMERLGDVTGDRDADIATFRRFAREACVPATPLSHEVVVARLYRETGMAAAAKGGEQFLCVGPRHTLTRGSTPEGLLG